MAGSKGTRTRRGRPGRPPLPPDRARDHVISVHLTAREWARIGEAATAAQVPFGVYIRAAALRRRLPTPAPPDAALAFALASALTAIAEDLRTAADGARAGRILGLDPALADGLDRAAHQLGLRLLGVPADAS